MIHREEFHLLENGDILGSYTLYYYNENNKCIQEEHYSKTENFYYIYEYDSYGNQVKYARYTANGVMEMASEYEREDQAITKEIFYGNGGVVQSFIVYEQSSPEELKQGATYQTVYRRYDASGNYCGKTVHDNVLFAAYGAN